MRQDKINASLEYLGVLFALYNCVILIQDGGSVQGVSILSTAFFTFWGVWNLYYYRHLSQHASAAAAGGLVIANGAWLLLFATHTGGYW